MKVSEQNFCAFQTLIFLETISVAQALVESMRQAEQIFVKQTRLSGLIRLTAPAIYCQRKLVPILAEFQTTYPEIRIELLLTNSNLNLIEERIDLAIRFGSLSDSSLISRKIGANYLVACASPNYLKSPQRSRKLPTYPCILFFFSIPTSSIDLQEAIYGFVILQRNRW
ncbi:MAG: hypothetical protein EOP06_00595 [Proteobacteria bacterium]|nr:MAG: hypothetical protein EOP06_00595 [Pseudomonadota bacterium]